MARWRTVALRLWRQPSPWWAGGRAHAYTMLSRAASPTAAERQSLDAPANVETPLSHPDYFEMAPLTTVERLLEARVHLGHKTGRWNPLMKPYIFGTRAGTHIINLDKTQSHLRTALNVAGHIAYRNGIILFVNERSQFDRLVQQTAQDCKEYFVTPKWRGGTLNNSHMVLGTLRLPDLVIFLSVPPSRTAIKEAAMCNIPSIGIVDTDCNPNLLMYPVPGNDDTPDALRLYCSLFAEIITRAKAKRREAIEDGRGEGEVEERESGREETEAEGGGGRV